MATYEELVSVPSTATAGQIPMADGEGSYTWGDAGEGGAATTTITIATTDWSNGSATVTLTGVTDDSIVMCSPSPSSASTIMDCGVYCSAQDDDELTFTATSTPNESVTFNVVIMDNSGAAPSPGPSPEPIPTRNGGAVFYDYDGTKLYEYTNAEVAELSALPSQPTHTGLTADGWNWTLAQIQAQLVADAEQPVIVGALYTTTSGATEIDVTLDSDQLEPAIRLHINKDAYIDWGDGSTQETITWTSSGINYSDVFTPHTYAQAGSYTIKIYSDTDGHIRLEASSNNMGRCGFIADANDANGSNSDSRYNTVVTSIRCGGNLDRATLSNTENLTTISITSSQIIPAYAFSNCHRLSYVSIPPTYTSITSTSNQSCILQDAIALTTVSLPAGLLYITDSMLRDCYTLCNVTIPSSVLGIGSNSFENCFALQYITIPSGVTSLNNGSIRSCFSLISITIPSGVTKLPTYVLADCVSLKNISINGSITEIGNYGLYNCRSLENISLPNSLTQIGANAFNCCYSLRSITIPNSVTTIGDSAFGSCFCLKELTIPSSVKTIGKNIVSSCYALSSLTIPNTVTSLDQQNLYYCQDLETYSYPTSLTVSGSNISLSCGYAKRLKSYTIPSGVTSFDFQNCYNLESITIPSTVTKLNNNALSYCYKLTSLTLSDNITTMGTSIFSYAINLRSVTLPAHITKLDNTTFQNCYNLRAVTIPDDVTSLGDSVFKACYSLKTLTIPANVTSISGSAFYACYGIEEYHFLRTTPPTLGTSAFYGIHDDCVIYVPRSENQTVLNTYQTATNWSSWASYMQEEPA